MLSKARQILVSELALAKKVADDRAEEMLDGFSPLIHSHCENGSPLRVNPRFLNCLVACHGIVTISMYSQSRLPTALHQR